MKRTICFLLMIVALPAAVLAQRGTTFTGTAVIYGSGLNTRTITRNFTFIVNGRTSPANTERYIRTLQRGGQDALLRDLENTDVGRFSLGGSVGVPVNAVLVDREGDVTRIRAVFK